MNNIKKNILNKTKLLCAVTTLCTTGFANADVINPVVQFDNQVAFSGSIADTAHGNGWINGGLANWDVFAVQGDFDLDGAKDDIAAVVQHTVNPHLGEVAPDQMIGVLFNVVPGAAFAFAGPIALVTHPDGNVQQPQHGDLLSLSYFKHNNHSDFKIEIDHLELVNGIGNGLGATGGRDGVSSQNKEITDDHIQRIQDVIDSVPSSGPWSLQAPAVPIPSAVWLFGSGLLGLIGMARRKDA